MTKKSPIEFYDEELSRTIRQIQQGLLELEWPSFPSSSKDTTATATAFETAATRKPEDIRASVDKLLTCAGVFIQQIELVVQGMPRRSLEKAQWTEILDFRKSTLAVLAEERASVKMFQFPSVESSDVSSGEYKNSRNPK